MGSFLQNIDELKYKKYIKYKFKYLTLKKQIGGAECNKDNSLPEVKEFCKKYTIKSIGARLKYYGQHNDEIPETFVDDFKNIVNDIDISRLVKWLKAIFPHIKIKLGTHITMTGLHRQTPSDDITLSSKFSEIIETILGLKNPFPKTNKTNPK